MVNSIQLQVGNSTEEHVINVFKKNHYWAYLTPRKLGGQPVDIIAIKGNPSVSWLVDAKHVDYKKVSFDLNRIEPNQWTTMLYANEWANIPIKNMGFAIEFDRVGAIYWLPYEIALEMSKNGEKSINLSKMQLLEEVL